MHKQWFVLAILVVIIIGLFSWFRRPESDMETEISEKIKNAYELSNPGSTVTDITLIPEGGVYKVIFKFDGDLVEIYVDRDGRYVFPVRTELSAAVEAMTAQKEFFSCLREQNTILYGVIGTNATDLQLRTLWSSPYLGNIYFDCSEERLDTCIAMNVTAVPSWAILGRLYAGVATVEDLETLTGCKFEG